MIIPPSAFHANMVKEPSVAHTNPVYIRPGIYPKAGYLKGTLGFNCKHKIRLERLTKVKHSSLVGPFVSNEEIRVF